MWKEFKDFAMSGNLVDMAIAFVMGAAFTKLTSAFIDGMVMPLVGMLMGGKNFDDYKTVLKEAVPAAADGTGAIAEVAVKWGAFITVSIEFVIVAFVMFMIIKSMNKMKKVEAAGPPPPPPAHIVLLEQIRDLLKK